MAEVLFIIPPVKGFALSDPRIVDSVNIRLTEIQRRIAEHFDYKPMDFQDDLTNGFKTNIFIDDSHVGHCRVVVEAERTLVYGIIY